MDQSLGKRIIANRKRVGFTQEQLADRLGVTAQAVSKWENDQSCPDIAMLPKLAELFGITIDELLGVTPNPDTAQPEPEVHEGEVVDDAACAEDDSAESEGLHINSRDFDINFGSGSKRGSLGLAVLVLTVGGLTLASEILNWDVSFWSILWPTALLVYGLFGVLPRFSFFRLGCLLFGLCSGLKVVLGDSSGVNMQLLSMIPYVVTVIVLILFVGKSHVPSANGKPYVKSK